MTQNTITVETWFVRMAGVPIDATVWVPAGSSALDAMIEAKREHGDNALAVKRPAGDYMRVTRAGVALRYQVGGTVQYVEHLRKIRRTIHTARYWRSEGNRAESAYWLNTAAQERREFAQALAASLFKDSA